MDVPLKSFIENKSIFAFKEQLADDMGELFGAFISSFRIPDHFIRTINLKECDSEQKKEKVRQILDLYDRIGSSSYKPKAIPDYYGFQTESPNSKTTCYTLLFKGVDVSYKSKISVSLIKHFNDIIEGLAFLQKLKIFPKNLDVHSFGYDKVSDQLFIDIFNIHNLMIDEQKYCENTLESDRKYFSPEKMKFFEKNQKISINPYKSEIFSLAMIFLEFAIKNLPQRDENYEIFWDQNIEEELQKSLLSESKYYVPKFLKCLKKCLTNDPNMRPDFNDIWEDSESIILIKYKSYFKQFLINF